MTDQLHKLYANRAPAPAHVIRDPGTSAWVVAFMDDGQWRFSAPKGDRKKADLYAAGRNKADLLEYRPGTQHHHALAAHREWLPAEPQRVGWLRKPLDGSTGVGEFLASLPPVVAHAALRGLMVVGVGERGPYGVGHAYVHVTVDDSDNNPLIVVHTVTDGPLVARADVLVGGWHRALPKAPWVRAPHLLPLREGATLHPLQGQVCIRYLAEQDPIRPVVLYQGSTTLSKHHSVSAAIQAVGRKFTWE